MTGRILALLALLGVTGCGSSTMTMTVQVYGGETASTNQEPSVDRLVGNVDQIASDVDRAAKRVADVTGGALADAELLRAALAKAEASLQAVGKDKAYAPAAADYLKAWKDAFPAVKTAASSATAEKDARAALDALWEKLQPEHAVKVNGVPVEGYLAASLRTLVGQHVAAAQKSDAVTLLARIGAAGACSAADSACAEKRASLAKDVAGGAGLVGAIADALATADAAKVDWSPGKLPEAAYAENLVTRLNEINDAAVKGAVSAAVTKTQTNAQGVRARAAAILQAKDRPPSTEPPRVWLAPELAAFEAAVGEFRAAAKASSASVESATASTAELRNALPREPLKSLGASAATGEGTDLAGLLADLSALTEKLGTALHVASQLTAAEVSARTAFRATDENLKVITDPIHEKDWRKIPIDDLAVDGAGDAQFVVVQETPLTYRLKRMHADPSKAVELTMSVADVGLDILKTFVLKGAPLPGDTGGTTPGTGEATSSGGSGGKDAAAVACRAGVRDLANKLRTELVQLPTKPAATGKEPAKPAAADPVQVARVTGILRGYRALLTACGGELDSDDESGDGKPSTSGDGSSGTTPTSTPPGS